MTPERINELRDFCGSFNNSPSWIVFECLDEIDRLEALIADCKPLDDAIRREQMEEDCKAVCEWCRTGYPTERWLDQTWLHTVTPPEWKPFCDASKIRRAFEEKK